MYRLIATSCLAIVLGVGAPQLFAGDEYEREADTVSDTVLRPNPVMRRDSKASAPVTRNRTGASQSSQVETGAGARAINRDDCNPLCGMKGIGEDVSRPVR